jgi:hypothetical protein
VAAKWGHGLLQVRSAVRVGSMAVRDGWRSVVGSSSRSYSGGWAGRQGVITAAVGRGAVAARCCGRRLRWVPEADNLTFSALLPLMTLVFMFRKRGGDLGPARRPGWSEQVVLPR